MKNRILDWLNNHSPLWAPGLVAAAVLTIIILCAPK